MVYPSCQRPIVDCHTCLPVSASSASKVPSSLPRNTLPSPSATPRLSQPQHTVEMFWSSPDLCSQISAPVLASSANTSSLPVETYITPSLTRGVASSEYFAPSPE